MTHLPHNIVSYLPDPATPWKINPHLFNQLLPSDQSPLFKQVVVSPSDPEYESSLYHPEIRVIYQEVLPDFAGPSYDQKPPGLDLNDLDALPSNPIARKEKGEPEQASASSSMMYRGIPPSWQVGEFPSNQESDGISNQVYHAALYRNPPALRNQPPTVKKR